MGNIRDVILKEFVEIIGLARNSLDQSGWDGGTTWRRYPNVNDYLRIRTRGLNLVRRVCGANSDHFQALQRLASGKEADQQPFLLGQCIGILEAAETISSETF